MPNRINFQHLATTPDRCGPHSPNNEAFDLRSALEHLDTNRDGNLSIAESHIRQAQFDRVYRAFQRFDRLLRRQGCTSVAVDPFRINALHRQRVGIIRMLGLNCQRVSQDC